MALKNRITSFLFANESPGQTVAKNTIWLASGQLTSRILRAAIIVYAARVLGAASWGAFSYALGIATFLTIFSDIGVNALITKTAARSPELKDRYIATALIAKLGLIFAFVAGIAVFFPYLTKIEEARLILPVLLFVFAFDTLRDLGSAISRALEKMEIEAGVQIFANLMIAALGFAFLGFRGTGQSLAIAYAAGSGAGLAVMFFILRSHVRHVFRNFTPSFIKPIFKTAWPFGLLGLMGVIMLNTDILMLGWLRPPEDVGYYAAAQKIVQVLYVLPALLATSIFPIMARSAKTDPALARTVLVRTLWVVFAAAAPITVLGIVFAAPIINILFGAAYAPSILSFKILMATILIVYPSTLLGNALFAYDAHRKFIWFVATATFGNVIFNLLLIPRFGIEGAAASTVFTQLFTNALIWRAMQNIHHLSMKSMLRGLRDLGKYATRLALANRHTRQLVKFLIIGATSFVIDFGLLNLMSLAFHIYSGPKIIILNTISFLVAVSNSYFFNKTWTFRHKSKMSFPEIAAYFSIYIVSTFFNSGIVFMLTTFAAPFGIDPQLWLNAAKIIATPLSLIWNFLGIKFVVFRQTKKIGSVY